jgi:hypothetical protein
LRSSATIFCAVAIGSSMVSAGVAGELDLRSEDREDADLHAALAHDHVRLERELAGLLVDQVRGDERRLRLRRRILQLVVAEPELTLADPRRVVAHESHGLDLERELRVLVGLLRIGSPIAAVDDDRVPVLDLRAVDKAGPPGRPPRGVSAGVM